jgi:hypothetical protein
MVNNIGTNYFMMTLAHIVSVPVTVLETDSCQSPIILCIATVMS